MPNKKDPTIRVRLPTMRVRVPIKILGIYLGSVTLTIPLETNETPSQKRRQNGKAGKLD